MRRPRVLSLVLGPGLLIASLLAAARTSAFPGANGKIAFASIRRGQQLRHLHDRSRRREPGEPHEQPGGRQPTRLVSGRNEDRLREHADRYLRDLHDERGRQRSVQPHAGDERQLRPYVVARRDEDPVLHEPRRRLRALRHEPGRQRPDPSDPHPRPRHHARLVARRDEDRVRPPGPREAPPTRST